MALCVEFGSVHSSLKLLHNELPASITYSAIKSEGAVVSMLDHSYSEETCICLLDSWTGPASRLSVQTRRENSNAFVALMLRKLRSDRSICQVWNGFEVPLQKDRKKKSRTDFRDDQGLSHMAPDGGGPQGRQTVRSIYSTSSLGWTEPAPVSAK